MKFIAFGKTDARVCSHSVCSTSLGPAKKSGFCSKHKNISDQQCSHDNCIAKIRKDNKSGFCKKKHSNLSSSKELSTSSSQPGSSKSIPTKQLIWPMVLCSYCNVLPVNALMNEKRKCQSCSKANNNRNVLTGTVIGINLQVYHLKIIFSFSLDSNNSKSHGMLTVSFYGFSLVNSIRKDMKRMVYKEGFNGRMR
ncbi:hypothetical protein CLU79DRAFT_750614 [Phycomyces nitens]|nr:hypothetical protein CLU79DRAFT_750614 [Phycomyces nitens]